MEPYLNLEKKVTKITIKNMFLRKNVFADYHKVFKA